jgi:hypothetical protein
MQTDYQNQIKLMDKRNAILILSGKNEKGEK